ncbi:MAG TPA: TSUP family transporter [Tissierellaceae bacterium]
MELLAQANIGVKILFLFVAGFFSAFIDSIAGGGGMISIPAYFIVGFPAHYTLGTNKFSATSGSLVSSINFAKSGKTDKEILKVILPFTFIGAILGVKAVLYLDSNVLEPVVLTLLLVVGLNSIFSKKMGLEDTYTGVTKKNLILGALLGFILGFYDGFFGPGTGSLIIFGLIKIYGFDFVRASGNAKVMNLTSNATSLIMFALNRKIYYLMGIPMGLAMILGAIAGSKLAIKEGSKFVRPVFVVMTLAVAVKIFYQMLF